MSKDNDGGAAFARPGFFHESPSFNGDHSSQEGMTLRDYFAGQAAAGLASGCGFQGGPWDTLARDAYRFADAMLAERQK